MSLLSNPVKNHLFTQGLTGLIILFSLILVSCGSSSSSTTPTYSLTLSATRVVVSSGFDPVKVTITLKKDGAALPGQVLTVNSPRGSLSPVTDNGDGSYTVTLTPPDTGVYPVNVSCKTASASLSALVLDKLGAGVGQPLAVPGDFVNTAGYDDGATITPDGQYLFVQYGPVYFSGIINVSTICSDTNYSMYNLNDCPGRPDSNWIFDSIGPIASPQRPNFPSARINAGTITYLSSIVVPNVVNGLMVPPTVFYGFKRQPDGSFADPFLLAFDDQGQAIQSPYGLSFHMTGSDTAEFAVAWNNYLNNLGDDGADIYAGNLTLGQPASLGTVTYDANDNMVTANPSITPVPFSSDLGTQGNPHLYVDPATDKVQSIWTDDEVSSHDLSVYQLVSGQFPGGVWSKLTLPSVINTSEEESQPFFTGKRLYLRRGNRIVYHQYLGTTHDDYDQASVWGPEVVVMQSSVNTKVGEVIAIGEPTIANLNGTKYMYFVYGIVRGVGITGLPDINMDVGYVELQ